MTPADKALRTNAYGQMRVALRNGTLVKLSECEDCGRSDIQIHGHHFKGYAPEQALDIVWLCWDCHAWRHATGHRRSEALPKEVRDAYRTIQRWADRPAMQERGIA